MGAGLGLSGVAGFLAGLLGIGGGPIKVPLQTEVLRVPVKTALANSNMMVGITACAAVSVHYAQGTIQGAILAPCALGIACGAYTGGRIAPRLDPRKLSYAFGLLLAFVALRMAWTAIG